MLNNMCMECKKFKNGCEGTECQTWTGCVYRETDANVMRRYHAALKKIGTLNVLKLPEPVKEILKQAMNLETKVDLLQQITNAK